MFTKALPAREVLLFKHNVQDKYDANASYVGDRTAERCELAKRGSRVQRSYDQRELEKAGRFPYPANIKRDPAFYCEII